MKLFRILVAIVFMSALLTLNSCKSNSTSSSNTNTTTTNFTIDGVNYSKVTMSCSGSSDYVIIGVDGNGSGMGVGADFSGGIPAAGTYTTPKLSVSPAFITCKSGTTSFYNSQLAGSTITVEVTGGKVKITFGPTTVTDPLTGATKTVSGTLICS